MTGTTRQLPPLRLAIRTEPALLDACMAAAQKHADAERDCIAAILSDPSKAIPIARAVGVDRHRFDHEDYRLMFDSTEVAAARGKVTVFRLIRAALHESTRWDSSQIRGNWRISSQWSDESLVQLMCSAPFLAGNVERCCTRLVWIDDLTRRARELWEAFILAMQEAASPFPPIEPPSPSHTTSTPGVPLVGPMRYSRRSR
jgi:hypothetical protein